VLYRASTKYNIYYILNISKILLNNRLVFTVFCIVCTVFLYCFVYVYFILNVLSVLVKGLLPLGEKVNCKENKVK